MPQLDTSFFPTQLVWLAISFALLYAVMAIVAIPRMRGVIAQRQGSIDGDLERAQALKSEADAAVAAYEKAMLDARNASRELLRQAGDRIAKQAEERQRALAERLAGQIASGEERIAAAKAAALADVRMVAAELARDAALRLAGVAVDDARVGAIIDERMSSQMARQSGGAT